MAAKVNTRFVLFLTIALGMATALSAGVWVLFVRGDVARKVRLGDEAAQAGQWEQARDHYGRALHKEPGNLQYLAKYEQATLQLKPKTADEAGELYISWLSILQHATRHDPLNAQTHLRLLKELHSGARRATQQWGVLGTSAKEMWERLPEHDAERPRAKVYQAIAIFRRPNLSTLEEITAALADLERVMPQLENSDLAWSAVVLGEIAILEKLQSQGRSGEVIDEQRRKVEEALARAEEAVPNGPEVARMRLGQRLTWVGADQGVISEQAVEAAERLASLLDENADPGLLIESASWIMNVPGGMAIAADLLSRYLQHHPNSFDTKLTLAALLVLTDQFEEAVRVANEVISSEPMSVSLLSQLQWEMRKRAAMVILDVECRRWEAATPQERPERMQAIQRTRALLGEYVSEPANDTLAVLADARIAFLSADFNRAARLFERLVRETDLGRDPETLLRSAMALERVNQLGRAHERVAEALRLRPGWTMLIISKTRLEMAMGRREEALQTLRQLSQADRELPEARELLATLTSMPEQPWQAPQNPVVQAIQAANRALASGESDRARALLSEALRQSPDSVPLLNALAAVEFGAANNTEAKRLLERSLEIEPGNGVAQQMHMLLTYDDPLEAVRVYHEHTFPNETERVLALVVAMNATFRQQAALVKHYESTQDPERAAKARRLSERAKAEADAFVAKAQELAPDHPMFLEFLLQQAIENQDWATADRLVARSRAIDADQAGGMFFKGRVELARGSALLAARKPHEARQVFLEAVRSLETASDRLGYSSVVWKALAAAHQSLGNFAQTERAMEQAYKSNPNDMEVVRAYAAVLVRSGEQVRALNILRTAAQIAPHDSLLRHLWLQLEFDAGNHVVALRSRREWYRESPNDWANAAELARLLGVMKPQRDTIVDANGSLVYSDQRWARMTVPERERVLAAAQVDWHRESDAILDTLTQRLGDDLQLASLRATLLRGRGSHAAGEQALREFISRQASPTSTMYIELAKYQSQANQWELAIASLREAIKIQDPDTRDGDHEMGQLLLRIGRFEESLPHLESVLAVRPDASIQNQAVECLVRLQRFDEAERRLREIVRTSGEDMITTLLAASIAEGRGQNLWSKGDKPAAERRFTEQREALLRAEALGPASTMPRVLLAQFFLKQYGRTQNTAALDDALQALDRAEQVRAGVPEVSLARVEVLLNRGDRTRAIGELQRLLQREPELVQPRAVLTQIYLEAERIDDALAVVEAGITVSPGNSRWHELKGDILRYGRNDAGQAYAAYIAAYDLGRTVNLLLKVSEAAFAGGSPDCRALVERYRIHEEELASTPLLREGLAQTLACLNQRPQAIEQMRLAFAQRQELIKTGQLPPREIGPWFGSLNYVFRSPQTGMVDAAAVEQLVQEMTNGKPELFHLRALAMTWLTGGGSPSRAIELQQRALDACPPDEPRLKMDLLVEMASYQLTARQFRGAVEAYQALLEHDPNHRDALNNLAFLLAEELNEPARAVTYALRALEIDPSNANILDTVGRSYFLAGDLENARTYLQRSIDERRTLEASVHMAELLVKVGDFAGAQRQVAEARRFKHDEATRDKLERLTDEINRGRASGAAR